MLRILTFVGTVAELRKWANLLRQKHAKKHTAR